MADYEVLIPCRSDATEKSYDVGDRVADGDFPEDVIINWVEIGVLKAVGQPDSLDITDSAWDLAVEHGLEKEVISLGEGSGADGRILVADVEAMIEEIING